MLYGCSFTITTNHYNFRTTPFYHLEAIEVVSKCAPEYVDSFKKVMLPTLSKNPSPLEQWEADMILGRKERFYSANGIPLETPFNWLQRVLYEETFSVNQIPGQVASSFEGSLGLTPGGLISHHYLGGSVDGGTIEEVLSYDLGKATLNEVLQALPDRKKRQHMMGVIRGITWPFYLGNIQPLRLDLFRLSRITDNPEQYKALKEMDTYGLRLLKMLQKVPELMQPIHDEKLKSLPFNKKIEGDIPLAKLLHLIWFSRLGETPGEIFTEQGRYRFETDGPEVIEGLKTLLFIRTHPEMQIIYQYLSPSGYLND